MNDWQEVQEPEGGYSAQLCGMKVVVYASGANSPGAWTWEVRFADGQVQSGYAEDPDAAMQKGKKVAERFIP
ncbi:MAG TPA: hypothetical protein VFD71_00605 [Planctomycetota bacterium]|nr:hypothetical protein [Planctomycetota bacterium]